MGRPCGPAPRSVPSTSETGAEYRSRARRLTPRATGLDLPVDVTRGRFSTTPPMNHDEAHAELTQFFTARFETLGARVRSPLERGDSCFVVEPLPEWLGPGLTLRLDVLPVASHPDESPRFLIAMVVDFGKYHRRMELTSGDLASIRAFAVPDGKCGALADAILELMRMERAGT